MKCFKFFLIYLGMTGICFANILSPVNDIDIKNGEITEVSISSNLSDTELEQFKNTKVTPTFYVVEYLADTRRFKVIVTNPEKENREQTQFVFQAKGFTYQYDDKMKTKDYILTQNGEYEINARPLSGWIQAVLILFLIQLIVLLAFICFHYLKKRRKKEKLEKERKNKIEELRNLMTKTKVRADFEALLQRQKVIMDYFEISLDKMNAFNKYIEKIQYKEEWTQEELDSALLKARFFENVREKDGI